LEHTTQAVVYAPDAIPNSSATDNPRHSETPVSHTKTPNGPETAFWEITQRISPGLAGLNPGFLEADFWLVWLPVVQRLPLLDGGKCVFRVVFQQNRSCPTTQLRWLNLSFAADIRALVRLLPHLTKAQGKRYAQQRKES